MGYSKASEIDWSSQKKGVMLFVKEYRPSKLLSSKNSIMGGFCLLSWALWCQDIPKIVLILKPTFVISDIY